MRQTRRPDPTTGDQPTPVVGAAKGLVAPEVCQSIGFRVCAFGVHDYGCIARELVEWKRAFEKELGKHGFPVYCDDLQYDLASYCHYPRGRGLSPAEWWVIGAVGDEVSRRLGNTVEWGGVADPWLWRLVPELARAEV